MPRFYRAPCGLAIPSCTPRPAPDASPEVIRRVRREPDRRALGRGDGHGARDGTSVSALQEPGHGPLLELRYLSINAVLRTFAARLEPWIRGSFRGTHRGATTWTNFSQQSRWLSARRRSLRALSRLPGAAGPAAQSSRT